MDMLKQGKAEMLTSCLDRGQFGEALPRFVPISAFQSFSMSAFFFRSAHYRIVRPTPIAFNEQLSG